MDIASLSIQVDSRPLGEAQKKMQGLTNIAYFTEKQMRALTSGFGETTRQTRELSTGFSNTGRIIEQATIRGLAGVAGLGLGIEGLVHVWNVLKEATDRAFEVQSLWVDFSAKAAIGASNVGRALRDEILVIVDSRTKVQDLTGEHDRLMVLRAELLAQGPEYRKALWDENAGYAEILNTLQLINQEKLKMVNDQIAEATRKGPEQSWKRFLKSDSNEVAGFYDGGRVHTTSRLGSTFDTIADTTAKENQLKYEKTLNDLYKQRAELMKGAAGLNGAYDKPGKTGGGSTDGGSSEAKDWSQGFYDIQDQESEVAKWSANYLKKTQETESAAAAYAKQYMDERTDYFLDKAEKDAQAQKGIYSDMFGDMTNTLHSWSGVAKESLTDFITTGKADFKGMISDWITDLARLSAQKGLKELAGGMEGSSTSWISTLGSLLGGSFADGGSPPVGKVSLVGERGPELFVPSTAGTIVPNGATGGSTINNSVTVNVSSSGQVDVKTASSQGTQAAKELEGMMTAWAIKQQRQGGIFASA